MKQEGLSYFTDTDLVSAGMLIFIVWFIGLLFWVYRKGANQQHEKMRMIPLKDGGNL